MSNNRVNGKFAIPKITTAARTGKALLIGELVFDKDLRSLYIGDGTTTGGIAICDDVAVDSKLAHVVDLLSADTEQAIQAAVSTLATKEDVAALASSAGEYTAFRVYADNTDNHSEVYSGGTYCPRFVPANIDFTGSSQMPSKLSDLYNKTSNPAVDEIKYAIGYLNYDVPKSMTERFVLLGPADWGSSNVVIDWGDGTQSKVANGKTKTPKGEGFYDKADLIDEWRDMHYMFSHTYDKEGSYLIKITGNDYWGIRHSYSGIVDHEGKQKYVTPNPGGCDARYNLVYDCFGFDTPVASCCSNLSSFCAYGKRLLHIRMTEKQQYITLKQTANFSNLFFGANNLVSVRGMNFYGYGLTLTQTVGGICGACSSLEIFDGTLPSYSASGYRDCFNACGRLKADISKLIPRGGFLNNEVNLQGCFTNAKQIYGTVPAALLWENWDKNWILGSREGQSLPFMACSDDIKDQVPVSWGGNAPDPEPPSTGGGDGGLEWITG